MSPVLNDLLAGVIATPEDTLNAWRALTAETAISLHALDRATFHKAWNGFDDRERGAYLSALQWAHDYPEEYLAMAEKLRGSGAREAFIHDALVAAGVAA